MAIFAHHQCGVEESICADLNVLINAGKNKVNVVIIGL